MPNIVIGVEEMLSKVKATFSGDSSTFILVTLA